MEDKILLFSGGIDSLSAWFYLGKPKAMYINLKTKYSKKEMKCIKELQKLIPDLTVDIINDINFGQFEEKKNAYIPNRNLLLSIIASNYSNNIILAGIKDDVVEDKNPKAFKEMSKLLTLISKQRNIKITSPFWDMSKIDIINWMKKNVDNYQKILETSVSCYSKGNKQCGNCPSCLRKAIAFENCGLDINFFKSNIKKSPLVKIYKEKFSNKNNKYTKDRIDNSLEVFKKWEK